MISLKDIRESGTPVEFQTYSGGKYTYITFFEYLRQPEQSCDDGENVIGHYIQIDIYSKNDYRALADRVRKALKNADFMCRSETEIYEEDTKLHHKCMRYLYLQEV